MMIHPSTTALLNIRLRQLMRGLTGIGLFRIVILAIMVATAVTAIYLNCKESPSALYTAGIYLLCLIAIQIKRKDKTFLKCNFHNYKHLLITEYQLLALPAYICLSIHFQWTILFALLIAVTLVIYINYTPQVRSFNSRIQQWLPDSCFEWKAGLRKNLIPFVIIWTGGMAASVWIIASPLATLMLGIIIFSFYNENEPLSMLLVFEKRPAQLIHHKIKMFSILLSITTFPLIAAFAIFHTQYWYVPVIIFMVELIFGTYAILVKYAFYQPSKNSAAAQTMGTIGALTTIMLPLIPVTIILMIRFYFKSLQNLKPYLNDFH
jgi:hypothetical protein